MALKKQSTPKRWRSKEAKEIIAVVQRAGGQVERTASGHLGELLTLPRLFGPRSIAVHLIRSAACTPPPPSKLNIVSSSGWQSTWQSASGDQAIEAAATARGRLVGTCGR